MKSRTLTYEESIKKLEELWADYHSLIPTYKKLISIKKELDMNQNAFAANFIKDEYPNIEFLQLDSLEDAIEFIYDLNLTKMRVLIRRIEDDKKYGVFYSAMKKWIRGSMADIRRYGMPRGYLGSSKTSAKNDLALKLLSTINYQEA